MSTPAFAIWSPHRNANCVNAFKAMLGLRAEQWVWSDQADQAHWWIIDGTRSDCGDHTEALRQKRGQSNLHAAILAPDWSAVKDPIWTFFKVPLQVSLVYRWIDASQPKRACLPISMTGRQLKLQRWPNMARYTGLVGMSESMQLTVACSRLLQGWASYEEVQSMVIVPSALDVVLRDAHEAGILELTPIETLSSTPSGFGLLLPPDLAANRASPERGAWSLVKRLLQKFS